MMPPMPLVSLLMAAYNAEKYIAEAILSALNQSYTNIELLIINDGSSDRTEEIILSFGSEKIRYFSQENQGVAAARNVLLAAMQGDYFMIFDADDILPKDSILSRMNVFYANKNVYFVDGIVTRKTADLQQIVEVCQPNYRGNPHPNLMRLDTRCFSVPAWLIRREKGKNYQMQVNMSHAEDLLFYVEISQNKNYLYDYIEEDVLYYRIHENMAMKKLEPLEKGYLDFYKSLKNYPVATFRILAYLKYKIARIMFLSYLRNKEIKKAIRALWRIAWV